MRLTNLTLTLAALWLALLATLLPPPAHAQWTNDPWNGMVSVCNAPNNQEIIKTCPLAGSKTFIAWVDMHVNPQMIYYQILDVLGNTVLQANGVPIISGNWTTSWGSGESVPRVVPDGAGGCVAVFWDNRNAYWNIYGQRFDPQGNPLWGPTGMPLVLWPGGNTSLKDVTTDSLGNGFIAWTKNLFPINELYLQKFDLSTAERLWGDMGVMDCGGVAGCDYQQIVADGQGGVIDVWEDNRPGGYTYYLYVQHLDANGNPLLAVNGIPILDLSGQQIVMGILEEGATDGRGGGIWHWVTPGSTNYLKLIRLSGQGQTLWLWTSSYYGSHAFYDMKRHSATNTVWISAGDNRPGAPGLYLYQFDIRGQALFGSGGLPYGGDSMSQTSNGMIVFGAYPVGQGTRFYALRVNSRGRVAWVTEVALSGLQGVFDYPVGTADGADGAIVAFEDWRQYPSTQIDISAQRVQWNGRLGNPVTHQPVADGEGSSLQMLPGGRVQFVLPQAGQIRLELFDLLGRRVATLREGFETAGMQIIVMDNMKLPSGIYLLRLRTPAGAQVIKVLVTH